MVESTKTSFFGPVHYELNDFRIVGSDSSHQVTLRQKQIEQPALELYFDFDSDVLRSAEKEQLTRWIMENSVQLLSVPHISIAGHTDQRGSAAYNQKLSELRAETVAAFPKEKIGKLTEYHIQGFGKESPKYSKDSLNRRVELHIIESYKSTNANMGK